MSIIIKGFAAIGVVVVLCIVVILVWYAIDVIKDKFMRRCEQCGKRIKQDDNYCSRCGKQATRR